jgi:hypothetical protein
MIGRTDDRFEQDADRVADQVTHMAEPSVPLTSGMPQVSRKCAACEEEEAKMLQPKARPMGAAVGEAPPIVHDVLRSPGEPLDPDTRGFMEQRFERDFRHIRIHTGEAAESAQAIDALAYTAGDRIVFGPGATPRKRRTGAG